MGHSLSAQFELINSNLAEVVVEIDFQVANRLPHSGKTSQLGRPYHYPELHKM